MLAFDVLAAMLAGPLGSSAANAETIRVDHKFSGVVCAGLCTNSHLVVRSDGLVELHVESLARKETLSVRHQITPPEFAEFRSVYSMIRPIGQKGPIGNCDENTSVIDWDIRWDGPSGNSRLLACQDAEAVRRAYFDGYRVLRISPATGQRLSPEEAALLR